MVSEAAVTQKPPLRVLLGLRAHQPDPEDQGDREASEAGSVVIVEASAEVLGAAEADLVTVVGSEIAVVSVEEEALATEDAAGLADNPMASLEAHHHPMLHQVLEADEAGTEVESVAARTARLMLAGTAIPGVVMPTMTDVVEVAGMVTVAASEALLAATVNPWLRVIEGMVVTGTEIVTASATGVVSAAAEETTTTRGNDTTTVMGMEIAIASGDTESDSTARFARFVGWVFDTASPASIRTFLHPFTWGKQSKSKAFDHVSTLSSTLLRRLGKQALFATSPIGYLPHLNKATASMSNQSHSSIYGGLGNIAQLASSLNILPSHQDRFDTDGLLLFTLHPSFRGFSFLFLW